MKGARLTPYRAAALDALRGSQNNPTAAKTCSKVRRRCPGVACATIFPALNWLRRNGLVAELQFGDEASRYDHLVCTRCGTLMDYEVSLAPRILSRAGRRHGFRGRRYRVESIGRCPRCSS